jgi:hypothetical protein
VCLFNHGRFYLNLPATQASIFGNTATGSGQQVYKPSATTMGGTAGVTTGWN